MAKTERTGKSGIEKPRKPDMKGRINVAAWKKIDKNGEEYWSVKLGQYFNLFQNKDIGKTDYSNDDEVEVELED